MNRPLTEPAVDSGPVGRESTTGSSANVRRPGRGRAERRWWTLVVVVGLVAGMAVAGTAGLHGVFETWRLLVPATIGAGGAGTVCIAAGRLRLLAGEAVAASALLFTLVGIATCGGPNAFFTGLTDGWADVLSSTPPADLTPSLRAVPFTLAWLGVLIGGELARHARQPALPAVGPLLTLGLAALLSSPGREVALVEGALVGAGALAVAVVQQLALRATAARPESSPSPGADDGSKRLVLAGRAAAMLAVVAVAAPFLGPQLPLAEARDRYDLRDRIDPPWDPLAVPSPLVQLKASLKEHRVDDVVFTVRADTPVTRWNLAVLGAYDGVVWTVGSGVAPAADEFRTVGQRLPDPPADAVDRDAPVATATVTIDDLAGPWLPTPGWATSVALEPAGDVRENLRTGTLAVTTGLPAGTTYEISARLPTTAADGDLAAAAVDLLPPSADLDVLPPAVRNLAADLVEGVDPGWAQMAEMRDQLRSTGFYDSSEMVPPGHSYFRLAEFLADPDRIIGYEEQYAAAAAVMARAARLPVRVVVGYVIPPDRYTDGTAEVRAGDISAWVEVRVDEHGWVPVDVTPDRSREPSADQQGTSFEDVAVPNPPPPPQPPPDLQVVSEQDEDEVDEPAEDEEEQATSASGGIGWQGWTAIGAGAALGLLFVLAAIVLVVKARRLQRRRTAGRAALRIVGAWREVSDRYAEAGVVAPARATPLETARTYLEAEPSAPAVRGELFGLVAVVDRAAYDATEPGDGDAAEAWQYCRTVVGALQADRSRWQRLRMRLDPRPLLRRQPRSPRTAGATAAIASTPDAGSLPPPGAARA
jgi:transglutaminase-like putative cysteine protease